MRKSIGRFIANVRARRFHQSDITLAGLGVGGKLLLIPHSGWGPLSHLDRADVLKLAGILSSDIVYVLARPNVDLPRPEGRIRILPYDTHDEGYFGGPGRALVDRVRSQRFRVGVDLEPRDDLFAALLLMRAGVMYRVGTSRMIEAPLHNVRIPLDEHEVGRLTRLTDALAGVVGAT